MMESCKLFNIKFLKLVTKYGNPVRGQTCKDNDNLNTHTTCKTSPCKYIPLKKNQGVD